MDDSLKTTYNSTVQAFPAIASHWRKFRRWVRDIVLHGNSDRQKLSAEYTTARQRFSEDPHQFYLRLFNLGIQSGRTVDVEEYRTRLVDPLQNLLSQHDRTYSTVQDAVAHAGKLWLTLNLDKIRREYKEEKDRARQNRQNKRDEKGSHQPSRKPNQGRQDQKDNRRSASQRLSDEERQYRKDNDLCFNCGYPGHQKSDCKHDFNPKRVQLRGDKDKAKSQSLRGRKRPHARSQPLHTSDNEDPGHDNPADTDYSASDDDERANKRQKN
jgi:Zinc knuckle